MSDVLVEMIQRYTDARAGDGPFTTAIEGLTILRANGERAPSHMIYKPALCAAVQGTKWMICGERRLEYRAGQALVVNVEMPALGRIVEASPSKPFLGVVIEFELAVMREVMEALHAPPQSDADAGAGVFVTNLDGPLADCVRRALLLLDTPKAIPILYPSIMREICYWLLTGPCGADVARIALVSGHAQRVISAIHALRDRFTELLRIEDLALIAQMSPSAFHREFKTLTSMTPLQYQKQLRLLEARRLMVEDSAKVETAAFRVGYESSSQFSREYARMFGAPPGRDVAALRGTFAQHEA
jgi:AraC-like DNA-binding protein